MDFLNTVTSKSIITLLIAFIICAISGPILIPVLRRLKFGQEIREEGPSWHKKKSGTPTMGGIMFIAAVCIAAAAFVRDVNVFIVLICAVLFGAVGFADDFIKVVKKRNLGLTASAKLVLQLIVSVAFVFILFKSGAVDEKLVLPFADVKLSLWYFYIPITVIFMSGFVNAVNLTDGLDGLASSVSAIVALFMAFAALVVYKNNDLAFLCFGVCGALIGFLIFNHHPAKVFMGDTGSLFLGGILSAAAILLRLHIILIIAGIVFILEELSVIIQVTYFKKTGKRVFKMSPIHHHFEMCGWSEKKIVFVFSLVSLAGCILAALSTVL